MTRSDSPRSTSHSRSVPSPLPLSRRRLSGVKARPYTTALCPSSAARPPPALPSHSQIVWSKLPLASVPPSGLQATQCTLSVCPTSVWRPRRLPVSPTSQSLTVPSQLALASRLPLGAKASPRTQLLCPQSVCTQRADPVLRISHSRIVPAKSPLASRRPSGLQASERTGMRHVLEGCAQLHIPEPDGGLISPTGEQAAARSKGQADGGLGLPARPERGTTFDVPQLESTIPAPSSQRAFVRAEGESRHNVRMGLPDQVQDLACLAPHSHFAPLAGCGPVLPAAADGHPPDGIKGLAKDALTQQCSRQVRVLQLDPLQRDTPQGEMGQV